jgi:hypothetical protein
VSPETPDHIPAGRKSAAADDRRSRLEIISGHLRGKVNENNNCTNDVIPLRLVEELVRDSPPTSDEILALGFDLQLVGTRIDEFLEGQFDRNLLHHWVCNSLKIAVVLSLRETCPDGALIEDTLGLMALVTDDDFASPDTSVRLCRLIDDRISLRLPAPCRRTISELLREMGEGFLIVTERGPDSEHPVWVDVSLLPRRHDATSAQSPRPTWFQPLSVCTESLWKEISPRDRWTGVENDRIPGLIAEEPWLTREFEGLSLYLDPDGITEAVVDATRIGSRELRKAVAGFRALHQMKRCSIDGIPVHSQKEDL